MGRYVYVGNKPQTAGNEAIHFGFDDSGNPDRYTPLGGTFEASDSEVENLRTNFVIRAAGEGEGDTALPEGYDDMSAADIRGASESWSYEEAGAALAAEHTRSEPRATVVSALETRLSTLAEAGEGGENQ